MKVDTSYYPTPNPQYDLDTTKSQSAPLNKVEVDKNNSAEDNKKLDSKKLNIGTDLNQPEEKPPESVLSREKLERVAEQLQEFVGSLNKSLNFTVDNDSGKDIIKVVDKTSGEIIRQIPSEEVLRLVTQLSNASGKLIDTRI